jgi:hypothetical protein
LFGNIGVHTDHKNCATFRVTLLPHCAFHDPDAAGGLCAKKQLDDIVCLRAFDQSDESFTRCFAIVGMSTVTEAGERWGLFARAVAIERMPAFRE